jgi:hypothetical protein
MKIFKVFNVDENEDYADEIEAVDAEDAAAKYHGSVDSYGVDHTPERKICVVDDSGNKTYWDTIAEASMNYYAYQSEAPPQP